MSLTRRSFLILVGAGTAAGVTGGIFGASPSEAASPAGDVVGKITVGYQGWFACIGDGAPINGWWHWSQNWGQPPSPSNNAIKAWPDVREYARGYQTAYANLNGGAAATLFSSYDQQSVNTHFLWMQQNGCDTAALQRPDLTPAGSLRSLVGSMAPFVFAFSRLSPGWGGTMVRATVLIPLVSVAGGVVFHLAGLHPVFIDSFSVRLAGLGEPAVLVGFCLTAIYACLIELYRDGRSRWLLLLLTNFLILVLTGARALIQVERDWWHRQTAGWTDDALLGLAARWARAEVRNPLWQRSRWARSTLSPAGRSTFASPATARIVDRVASGIWLLSPTSDSVAAPSAPIKSARVAL